MEALHLREAVDLVQVVEDVGWRGVRIDGGHAGTKKGKPTAFPVSRGTVIGISPGEALGFRPKLCAGLCARWGRLCGAPIWTAGFKLV
jgi:hypothetical protein